MRQPIWRRFAFDADPGFRQTVLADPQGATFTASELRVA
jgi:hypothetical protein